jgi:hypothetical protein
MFRIKKVFFFFLLLLPLFLFIVFGEAKTGECAQRLINVYSTQTCRVIIKNKILCRITWRVSARRLNKERERERKIWLPSRQDQEKYIQKYTSWQRTALSGKAMRNADHVHITSLSLQNNNHNQ